MKKLLSLLLSVVLILSTVPVVFADTAVAGEITLVDNGEIANYNLGEDYVPVWNMDVGGSEIVANPAEGATGQVLKLDFSKIAAGNSDVWAAVVEKKFKEGLVNTLSYDIYMDGLLDENHGDFVYDPYIRIYPDWTNNKDNHTAYGGGSLVRLLWNKDDMKYYFNMKDEGGNGHSVDAKASTWYRVIHEVSGDGKSYKGYVLDLSDPAATPTLVNTYKIQDATVFGGICCYQVLPSNVTTAKPIYLDNLTIKAVAAEADIEINSFAMNDTLSATVNIPSGVKSADVYLADTKIAEISDVTTAGEYALSCPWNGLGINELKSCTFTLNCYDGDGLKTEIKSVSATPSVKITHEAYKEGYILPAATSSFGNWDSAGFVGGREVKIYDKGVVEINYDFKASNVSLFNIQYNVYDSTGNNPGYAGEATYKDVIKDGKITCGNYSGQTPDPNTWYKVKVQLDSINDKGYYWISKKDESFNAVADYSGKLSGEGRGFGLQIPLAKANIESGGSLEYGNMVINRVYTMSDIGTEALANGTESDAISLGTVAFDTGLESSVSVKKDGVAIASGVSFSLADKTLTITPEGGFTKGKYTVEISKTASIGGSTSVLSAPILKEYLVCDDEGYYFGATGITIGDKEYSAGFEYANLNDADREVAIILATYSGNRLNQIKAMSHAKLLANNAGTLNVSVLKTDGDSDVRAFVWDSLATPTPIAMDAINLSK